MTFKLSLLLLTLSLLILPLTSGQQIKGFVNDYAGVLSQQDISELESIQKALYDQGAAEYAIVIINSLEGKDIESYSYELAEGKLGDKEKNNGLLLLVAIDDRKYRFEVGRGLEPELPDITVGRIGRDYFVQNFRNDDYGKGIIEASRAVQARLTNQTSSEYYGADYSAEDKVLETADKIRLIVVFVVFITIVLIFVAAFYRAFKKRKGERPDDTNYFIAAWVLSQMSRKGPGGSTGGFGGFGGGSFGGGGASGGW